MKYVTMFVFALILASTVATTAHAYPNTGMSNSDGGPRDMSSGLP